MSNPVAPSANVKDKIKRGPRIEYSDVEEDGIDPTGQLTNKRGTGANGQKRNHGKTTPSTAAISTPKVSKDDPPTTSTTPKEVDLKDPKPQGQDSSGSSTAMSAENMQHADANVDTTTDHNVEEIKAPIVSNSDTLAGHVKKMSGDNDIEVAASLSLHEHTTPGPSITDTNVQDSDNVPDSSNSSSGTQTHSISTLTDVETTDVAKTSGISKTKAEQKIDTPGTIASKVQDNDNVADSNNSSSGTQRNTMSTLTAVGTTDNGKISDISNTKADQKIDTPGTIASTVQEHDDEYVSTSHSVDEPIGTSAMADVNGSRDQTITTVGMTQDNQSVDTCSSIDTNGETNPLVTVATDGTKTKTWSNQQITKSLYTHAVISVLISIVCSCLVSWFLVPQQMRSVQTPISRPPDPSPLPPTYDPKMIQRMIQNELVKEYERLRMIQNELVEEDERLSRMQMKQSASFDAFRKEVNEKIQANVQQNDAFESNLKNRVEEETASRKRLRLEFEVKVSDVKTELIADIDSRSVNLPNEAQAHKNDIESLYSNHKSLRKQVERIQEEVKVVPGLQSNVENLSNNAEIQESHMKSVIRILTHPDVGPLHIAVALLFMFVLYTWYLISTINRQHHRVVHSVERTEREHVSRHEPSILERVAVPGRLDNTVCILGFYKSTLELRTRLTQSVLEPGTNQAHFLLDNHEDILRLPPCRLFLVFVDNNERHVILEDPSLCIGDLRLTTVRAIEKMGASMAVIYYGGHESRNIGDHLFNRRLTSVQHQSELSALCKRDRFFSTANTFTDRQIHALKKAVAAEIN